MDKAYIEMVQLDGTRRIVMVEVLPSGLLVVTVGRDTCRMQVSRSGALISAEVLLGLADLGPPVVRPSVILVVAPEVEL